MVPAYLEFAVLVETRKLVEGPLLAPSECGGFQVDERLDSN